MFSSNNYGYCSIDKYYAGIYADRATMSEQHGTGVTIKFGKYTCDHGNVESGCNKYGNSWDNDLYVYTRSRTVCICCDNEYCCNSICCTCIYTDRATVSEQHGPGLTNKFGKYTCDHGNVESGYNKYGSSRDNYIYIYTRSGTVCICCDNEYSCNAIYYHDLYTDRPAVSEQHGPGLTNKFDKYTSDHRNVESGCNKYGDSRGQRPIRLHQEQDSVHLLRQ